MRIILFTGKGGVGKTTLSAATGTYLSELGKKVLVVSVDPAHSLSDVLEEDVGPEPKKIFSNFYAQEIDVYYSIEKFWGILKEYLKSLLKWQGIDEILAEEMSVLPGMEEVSSFLWINKHVEDKKFDVIIVDSAPTGETLRFLSLPDAASWWITKILPLQRKLMKFIRPAAKVVTDIPLPEEETYDALEDLFRQVYNLYYLLQNSQVSSVRLVVNPEKMVIKETEKAFTYLHLFGFPVDGVFMNRVAEKESPFYQIQRKYVERIAKSFEPTPIFMIPQLYEEILGYEKLKKFGKRIYQDKNPAEVFYKDKPFEILEKNGEYILKLALKEVPQEELEVYQKDEDLIIKIGNHKKHFFLPRVLLNKEIKGAVIKEKFLEIGFS
ncbi:MAG: Anion-transporting ATPase [Thermodesulfobacterium sp.]|uniref:arsenite-transporting ATPase n=1 Tax=Candidatus Thermodesulfobacterium syntrophicum TaxID=3060442 RepID=A0AAE3P5D2_9BACT|nr:Anion-transporting ATPase [Candidatus Thermodesulfobacterium syntrophicum]